MRITATTARVVSNKVESISPKAPNKSPSNPPGPVTYGVKPLASAIGLISSRSASIAAGSTGSSFGSNLEIAFPSSGIFAKSAFPSCDGKTEIS